MHGILRKTISIKEGKRKLKLLLENRKYFLSASLLIVGNLNHEQVTCSSLLLLYKVEEASDRTSAKASVVNFFDRIE